VAAELGEDRAGQEWLDASLAGLALSPTSRRQELHRLCELSGPMGRLLSARLASQGVKLATGQKGWSAE